MGIHNKFHLKTGDAKFLDGKIQLMMIWLTDFWRRTENLEVEGLLG